MLLSDWSFTPEEQLFLVPTLVRDSHDIQPNGVCCKIDFSDGPDYYGVFHRMCCVFVSHSSGLGMCQEPIVTATSCKVYFGHIAIYLEQIAGNVVKMFVEDPAECAGVLPVILSLLRKLSQDNHLKNTLWLHSGDDFVKYEAAAKELLPPWFQVRATPVETRLDIGAFLDWQQPRESTHAS